LTTALIGDVWDLVNYGPRPAFYNPQATPAPSSAVVQAIPWNAFPGRLSALFPNNSDQWNEWADTGQIPDMTANLCVGPISSTPYTPTGPCGWQDEYCEWSVQRDANDEIASIMFSCENPEYWLTLWEVDPSAVVSIYRTLVNSAVTLDDLSLKDLSGAVIAHPLTGQPVYNPLNKWNTGNENTREFRWIGVPHQFAQHARRGI
jgi:hypothetical protein